MRLPYTIILILSTNFLIAQPTISLQWQKTVGTVLDEQFRQGQPTSDGGCILGGYNTSDFYLVKLDKNHNVQWQKSMGTTVVDYFTSIEQTADGGYILGGSPDGLYNYWVVKTDSSGNVQWQKSMSASGIDFLRCLRQTPDGGYLVGGSSNSPVSGQKTIGNRGGYDFWVIKLNGVGDIQWQRVYGGSDNDELYSIQLTSDGGYLLAGESSSGVSGEKTEAARGIADFWILKINSAGNIIWQKTLGGSGIDRGFVKAHELADGGYIIGGYSTSFANGDKTAPPFGNTDYWMIRLDSSRNILWDKAFGGSGDDEMFDVKPTHDGGYILGGRSTSGISGIKNEGNRGDFDYWVVKTDPLGTVLWQKTVGGSLKDELFSINETSPGTYLLSGHSYSPISGEKTENSQRGDFWVVQLSELPQVNTIKGIVFQSADSNCLKLPEEPPLQNMIIQVLPGGNFAQTDSLGFYQFPVDTGSHQVRIMLPERVKFLSKQLCTDSIGVHPVRFAGYGNDTLINSAVQMQNCAYLTIDLTSDRRRRCATNNTVIQYCNEGIATSTNTEVHVSFPQYVKFVRSDKLYNVAADGHYIFSVGSLKGGECGTIHIVDSVECVPGIAGITQCTKAWITPANTCAKDSANWDRSNIEVSGNCKGDSVVRLVIRNKGLDMQGNSEYRIFADGVLAIKNAFNLKAGDSIVLETYSFGMTIRLEADQLPGHPRNSHPNVVVEGCGLNILGTKSNGFVTQQASDDEEVDLEQDCLPIRDSYDPNDKNVSPSGVTSARMVKHAVSLDYQINFQNTGNDTAYKVVVVDTLSPLLNIATLQWGASSHPYAVSVSGKGQPVLVFTFNKINLVDSVTNEKASHGFVKFKIKPFDSIPNETTLHNTADIYFDFNSPVRTNDAWVTIDDNLPSGAALNIKVIKDSAGTIIEPAEMKFYPNPSRGTSILEMKGIGEGMKLLIYDISGRRVTMMVLNNIPRQEINTGNLSNGLYLYSVVDGQGNPLYKGKLIVAR